MSLTEYINIVMTTLGLQMAWDVSGALVMGLGIGALILGARLAWRSFKTMAK